MTRIINPNGTLNAYNIAGHEIQPGDHYGYKVVAVVYSQEHWCAYRGLTDWDDERVATNGDKVSYDVARELFPTIAAVIPNYYD